MTSEGSERVERRKECKEHVDAEEFRQQMRELIEEVKEQVNREEVEVGMESGNANEEREAEAKRESTDIDEESEGDDEFRREMQELIAEVREISEKEESEDSDEFRKQMRELIDEVERDLEADGEIADSAEDRLDEFEEDILENFEKYSIDGDEVRERWRERFVEDVEEELEKDSASDEPDESTNTSDDAADSEMNKTTESCSYSESGDGTVQVLKTEGNSEATESVDESEEHKAEMEPQSESDSSVESEKDRAVEESKQKEDMESPEAAKQPEKQIARETESETSENSKQHELKHDLKESILETSEDARARQQTSELVSESSDEKAEAAERKEAQAESIESHSARAECEELVKEEVEDTQIEDNLSESNEEEVEVTQDSGSEIMQEWTEDGESEELADSEHLEEPDSTQSTLESNQEVLEESISPDVEEHDEDEEVDERVVSDDERLTEMLDSPYPTVYVDETGFFAETEERRWRRKLVELYNDLPEEMKQLYRELVKTMLESEEGLEKLLDTFPELKEQEEFEEKHEDAIEYVRFRQKLRELALLGALEETTVEKLALELAVDQETVEKWLNDDYYSFPKIIQQVWNQEIERRWGNVLQAIANRNVPYDMSKVNEALKQFPELKSAPHFELYYDEVKVWTEVMAAKRQGKIATLIIQGKERFKVDEVKELAKRLNLTVDKAVHWLRDKDRPRLVDVLTEKNEFMKEYVERGVTAKDDEERNKSIQESTTKRPRRQAQDEANWSESDSVGRKLCPSTLDEYETLLERHSLVRESPTFKRDDHYARVYYKIEKILESSELSHLSARGQWRVLSKQFSTKAGTIKAWFTQDKTPGMISRLGRLERKRLKPNLGTKKINQKRTLYLPNSLNNYLVLLKRHPYVVEHPEFEKRDRYARVYFEIKQIRETNPDIRLSLLSKRYDILQGTISQWFNQISVPDILQQLASNERLRLEYEAKIPPVARLHRFDPSVVYEVLRPLKDCRHLTASIVAGTISRFCSMIPEDKKVAFVELRPYNMKLGPRWLLDVGKSIDANLTELERLLNEQKSSGSMRYRLGFVDRTLYIRRYKDSPYDYLTLFGGECFYFSPNDKKSLVHDTRNHLNLQGNYVFTQLLQQITDISEVGRESFSEVAADLRHDRNHLFGETIRFILDVVGKKLTDIGSQVLAIGQHEQIKNPCILEGADLLELMARLYAITASDGHVGRKWNFLGYYEYNLDRVRIVKEMVQRFGEVRFSYFYDEGKIAGLRFPHVLGRLMIKLGMPTGDKSIQGVGLPDFILNGPPEILCAYLEAVIPEDGYITISHKSHRIGIARNAVLYDLEMGVQYGFEQKISQEHIKLIQRFGRRLKGLVGGKTLAIGKLRELASSEDPVDSQLGSQLLHIALDNPVALLFDEHKIMQDLGFICPLPSFIQLNWFEKTGRVSATWKLTLSNQISMAKWGLLALPNDIRKRANLIRWMKQNPKKVIEAQDQLRADGLLSE